MLKYTTLTIKQFYEQSFYDQSFSFVLYIYPKYEQNDCRNEPRITFLFETCIDHYAN